MLLSDSAGMVLFAVPGFCYLHTGVVDFCLYHDRWKAFIYLYIYLSTPSPVNYFSVATF